MIKKKSHAGNETISIPLKPSQQPLHIDPSDYRYVHSFVCDHYGYRFSTHNPIYNASHVPHFSKTSVMQFHRLWAVLHTVSRENYG